MRSILSAVVLVLLASAAFAQTPVIRGILPVAGSTPGAFQSQFKTSLQLHNRGDETATGMLVFHANGVPATAEDPMLAYEIGPRETVFLPDAVGAMGVTGIGSIDLIPTAGPVPAVMARAFDDNETGTSGATIPLLDPRDALMPGRTALLIVPDDLEQYRMNLGIRSLADGAVVRMTVYGTNGIERFSTERTLAPHLLEQKTALEMLGSPLLEGDAIALELVSGAALVYGTTTDNVSNDPSLQAASALEPLP